MPEFAVLIYANDSLHAPTASNEQLKECDEHFESLVTTGRMRVAYALTPRSHARTLRADGVTDQPYHGTNDVVAGFYVLIAKDIDEAVALAQKDPAILSGGVVDPR